MTVHPSPASTGPDRDDISQLRPASRRIPLPDYIGQLWRRRHFIHAQAWGQATAGHHGTLLGHAWLVAAPLLDGLMYFFVFGVILDISKGMSNFFGYLIIGVFLFSFSARTLTHSARCIDANRGLLRAFMFPRAALPVAVTWRELLGLGPVLGTLLVLLIVVPPHAPPKWTWLLLPALVAMQWSFNLGLALIAARLGAQFPDLTHVLPYLSRAWMYGSAVMFSVEQFVNTPLLEWLVANNPLYIALTITREVLLNGSLASGEMWLKMALWAIILPLVGLVFFWQSEVAYGRRAHE